ncbi:hypothetical protein EW146_g6556 [Bondarzewia mesenterica]|uniref:RNA polymerase II-associated protein 1 C-terminal domain-containing protein n=1 Tax=Bondarzewia mesenterica TaxID=1095465 RepID=A0A4S4LTV6_9AGAM|nr:hypothetical protein EW146_g6556 [Bondarzewia mesenterica]
MIGSVFERKTGSTPAVPTPKISASGFPVVQHRSKSAFARGREKLNKPEHGLIRPTEPPVVKATSTPGTLTSGDGDWRQQISEENERRVAAMTEQEREQERREIEERFGKGIADVLRKAREARERQLERDREQKEEEPVQLKHDKEVQDHFSGVSQNEEMRNALDLQSLESRLSPKAKIQSPPPSPPPILSPSSTRPSSRAARKLRFADVTPNDVHVYESAPPSPRRKPLALPPPTTDEPVTSLGQWRGRKSFMSDGEQDAVMTFASSDQRMNKASEPPEKSEPEEGTPEYIRRRFFPNVPAHDPNLEWIEALPSSDSTSIDSLRFDLTGAPIPPSVSATLPTHLGLHHHAEGSRAGYTIDDIFLLTRSSVPAQRTTMIGVLARIIHRLGKMRRGVRVMEKDLEELHGKEEELRKRALAAGIEAIAEKGSVGVRAVELIWECVVGWDDMLAGLDGVELQEEPPAGLPSDEEDKAKDALSSLPLEFVLQQIADAFGVAALPQESLLQLLSVVSRLAKQSNSIAAIIAATPSLVANVLRTFVLTSIPPTASSPPPSPIAIDLLTTIALSSRMNASSLVNPTDSLLRFVTMLPAVSPYPPLLATALLTSTLRLYVALASYGIYSHIATTASEPLTRLSSYILSPACESRALMEAYAQLIEAWTICAIDPHQTTPEHEILWSQVVGWGWGQEVLDLRAKLGREEGDWDVWAAIWRAEAAWLEGARVNGVRNGEGERSATVDAVKAGFATGAEKEVLLGAMSGLHHALTVFADRSGDADTVPQLRTLARYASIALAAVRFWLACIPSGLEHLPEPPFELSFELLSTLSASIAVHPLLVSIYDVRTPSYAHIFCRPLTALLASYIRVSRRQPTTSEDLWFAQSCAVLPCLMPGDEDFARSNVQSIVELVNEQFMQSRGWAVPQVIWEQGGMSVIAPFLTIPLRQNEEHYMGPLIPTPRSIKHATTQCLPPAWAVRRCVHDSNLPLARDWPLAPLDHLLRSGTSSVWKRLPSSWDASETEVVRTALLLAKVAREVLQVHGLGRSAMGRAETVFSCMKVFMLEHGQAQDAASEVFRDQVVGALMEDLLAPCTLQASPDGLSASPAPSPSQAAARMEDLEIVSARFLGSGTPFYQFYTDFVALYDAISFAHPIFASLLLPPTARHYGVDYRKLLYADTAHVLGTVRTPVERIVGARLGDYLWPAEDDAEVVGAYLGVLLGHRGRGHVEGFVRLFVVHHVAANIWPDLRVDGTVGEARARKLLEAMVGQGSHEELREVVMYWQKREGNVVLPPDCFVLPADRKTARAAWIKKWAAESISERILGLLVS